MPAFVSPHSSPYARLVANVTEDGECWLGTEKSSGRGTYQQINFRVPGLGGRIKHFSAHVLAWIIDQTESADLNELFLYDLEFRCSGLEIGHGCHTPACRRASHLTPMTHRENIAQRDARRAPRVGAPEPDEVPF